MSNETMIIGVDNGYGLTKTVHTEFTTSIKDNGTVKPPFMENVVTYHGNYYIIGGGDRMKVKTDKTVDNETYILTLAAIGAELELKGVTEANIILSVGLPLERCGSGSQAFKDYFLKEQPLQFDYKDVSYNITIEKVIVSPQGYAAVINELSTLEDSTVIVDIGSWTIDILQLAQNIPTDYKSLNKGVITCINDANDAIRASFGNEVKESQIQKIMCGNENVLPEKYEAIVKKTIRKYVEDIANTLQERGYNIDTLDFIFVGGGAFVIKNFGMDLFTNARTITNIHANAEGYEAIAKAKTR